MKSPSDRLSALVGPPTSRAYSGAAPVSELDRILALPKRTPYDCDRDDLTGRYLPTTQALMEITTARFTRGPRLSCACRPRKIKMMSSGMISIERLLPDGSIAGEPKFVSLQAFINDIPRDHAASLQIAQQIAQLKPGEMFNAPAADGAFGMPCIDELNPTQAWTLHEAPQAGGIIGFKGVGSGKSVSGVLAPLVFPDAVLGVLCIEPKQRRHYKSHYLRVREHFNVSSIVFDDNETYVVPGTVPLHLISYSVLSRTTSSDLLDLRSPGLLILDEAHRACGDSAINRRIKRYIASKIALREAAMNRGEPVSRRAVYLLDWSGTLENHSVQDTQMLSAYSLGTGSPLPLDPDEAIGWSCVMDANRRPDRKSVTAKRLHMAFGDGEVPEENWLSETLGSPEKAVRKGFQVRRSHTLGVISANASSVNASIFFSERKTPKMPDVIREALRRVQIENVNPDGVDLEDRLHQVTTAREVACGFYNYWAFPKHLCTCVPGESRCDRCKLIDDWFLKRKAYNKELRAKLLDGELHMDSPELCKDAAKRFWQDPPYKGKLPIWSCEAWPAWRDIEDKIVYEERTRWLGADTIEAKDPVTHPGFWLARDAAEWALKHKGVVWFKSVPFGRKIAELSGLPYFNGGPGCEERLGKEKGDRSIICSIKALGAGTDGLQYKFHRQLIVEMPSSNGGNEGMEQLLGRLHRQGQPKSEIFTEGYFQSVEFRDAFRQVIKNAEFNFEMMKTRQKILLCDRDLEWAD